MAAKKPTQRIKGLGRRQEESRASYPEGANTGSSPKFGAVNRRPGTPERTRRPILGGSTHQELEHDVGREGEEGVKGASATALLPDSSLARGRNPPSGSGLRPAPPSPCPEATCSAAAPPDSHRGKQCKPSLRTKASVKPRPGNLSSFNYAGNCDNIVGLGASWPIQPG